MESKIKKEIIPIFFTYDNGIYNIFVYSFEDINDYNSIKLKYVRRFMISSKSSEDLKKEMLINTNLIKPTLSNPPNVA